MNFRLLQVFENYIEANIVMGRLQEEGINCWLKDEHLVTTIPLWNQAVGGIKLMVAETQLDRAKELLHGFKESKKTTYTCPACGSSDIEYISSPRKAANWLSVLAGFLFLNYAMPVKTWLCFSCGAEFKEPKDSSDQAYRN